MERYYQFAGVTVKVSGDDREVFRDDGILSDFRVARCAADFSLELRVVDRVDPPSGTRVFQNGALSIFRDDDQELRYVGGTGEIGENAYLRISGCGEHGVAQFRRRDISGHITPKNALNAMEAEHLLAEHGALLLHASYICCNGQAILFTAPSGTGKSTQAELWRTLRGAALINGDRAAIRMLGGDAVAAGVPFSGSSGVCRNETMPLRAIVYLSQAKTTTIRRLGMSEAFRRVWEGCSVNVWNRADVESCTQTLAETLNAIPVFHLACTPDETAVAALEKALERLE